MLRHFNVKRFSESLISIGFRVLRGQRNQLTVSAISFHKCTSHLPPLLT